MQVRKKLFSLLVFTIWITSMPMAGQISATDVNKGTDQSIVDDIVIVFKMHFDIGYTDWAESILQKYSTSMMEETLQSVVETSNIRKEEQFVWTLPGWPLKYILENTSETYKPKVEKAIIDGRFKAHALPFTFQTESSDLETLVRGMSFSSQINRKYNQPLSISAKLTDVPSHSWALPTLLTQAGVKILHIGCNSGSTSPDIPTLFWWEGPDGSRLLTFNWAEYYGSGVMPPDNWKYKTWLAMIHTHENTGAPTPEIVESILKEAREKAPNARIKIGQLDDFYDILMKENPKIPVIKGDMPDTWIHGYMSMPREVKINKSLQRTIYNAETLNTSLKRWNVVSEPITPYIEKAVESSLLFDEHTFGLAMSHGNQGDWKYDDDFVINRALGQYDLIEESWNEKGSRVHRAQQYIIPSLRKDLNNLSSSISIEGKRVVVYNPLPWQRSGTVDFYMGVYQKDFQVYGLKDETTNKVILANNDNNFLSFYADDVPSLGYKTYTLITSPISKVSKTSYIDEHNSIIENKYFKIEINKENGSLVSVWDKQLKKEMVDKESEYGFGEYIHEKFGEDEINRYNEAYIKPTAIHWANDEMGRPSNSGLEYQLIKGNTTQIKYKETNNSISATSFCKTSEGDNYTLTYTLYDNSPYLEICWGIQNKPAEPRPEGGWLAFPFNLSDPTFHLGRTGAIVNPSTDFIKNTNHDYYFVNTGLAVVDKKDKGFGLNTPNAPAVSLDRPGLFRFSGEFYPKEANVFVNLFNNQWGTNFTEWIEGGFSAKVYLWSIDKYENEKSLITPTEETRVPLMGSYSEGKGGNLPISNEGITLSKKGVLVTSFGPNKDGNGDVLRLWEQSGNKGECVVKISGKPYKTAQLCNLRGEPLGETLMVKNNELSVDINSFQPITIILEE